MTRALAAPVPSTEPHALRPPGLLHLFLEGRAAFESAALVAAWPWLSLLPRGDGHPVLVFPGLGTSDLSTIPLRRFLRRLGYTVQAWGQGSNFGPRRGVLQRCNTDVQALAERHGQPVSLIGWSLGGLYAREVAKDLPEHVRSVITLGTPFGGHPRATNAWRIYEFLSGQKAHDPVQLARMRVAPPVPTTSIYSRSDGIVSWRCSLNESGPLAENIEVRASHFGLGVNPAVLAVIADRLAQPADGWQRFEAKGLRSLLAVERAPRGDRAEPDSSMSSNA